MNYCEQIIGKVNINKEVIVVSVDLKQPQLYMRQHPLLEVTPILETPVI